MNFYSYITSKIKNEISSLLTSPPPYKIKGFGRFSSKKAAFTLAETLMTLTIIGIIAAMTVPTLMGKYQNHQLYVALKANQAILANAYQMAVRENGTLEDWISATDLGDLKTALPIITEPIMSNIKYTKACKVQEEGCWSPEGTWLLNKKKKFCEDGKGFVVPIIYRMENGANIMFNTRTWENGADMYYYYGRKKNGRFMSVTIDVNGDKKPNILGRDTFTFVITKDELLPAGSAEDTANCTPKKTNKKIGNSQYEQDNYAGSTCTYKVLTEGGIFY